MAKFGCDRVRLMLVDDEVVVRRRVITCMADIEVATEACEVAEALRMCSAIRSALYSPILSCQALRV